MTEKPKLETEKEYTVEMYPKDEQVNAKYVGLYGNFHVFENDENRILVDDHWISEERGLITYISFSSMSIHKLPKSQY